MSYNKAIKINLENLEWSDDVFTVTDFLEMVSCGGFIDYDGYGYPVKDDLYDKSIIIRPSNVNEVLPEDATHIIWFNR